VKFWEELKWNIVCK